MKSTLIGITISLLGIYTAETGGMDAMQLVGMVLLITGSHIYIHGK